MCSVTAKCSKKYSKYSSSRCILSFKGSFEIKTSQKVLLIMREVLVLILILLLLITTTLRWFANDTARFMFIIVCGETSVHPYGKEQSFFFFHKS